jgi:hypothetical protein
MYNLATLGHPGPLKFHRVPLHCAMAPSSLSSSSSSSDEERILELRGLPEVILVGLATAMGQSGRKRLQRRHGGSRPGKRPNRNIGREDAARRLHADFFLPRNETNPYGGTGPTFTPAEFERRLRVNSRVYERIKTGVTASDEKYFIQRADAVRKLGVTTEQQIRSSASPCASSGKVLALIQW